LTFTIVGAGPTGVELAGIIAELAHVTLPQEFRNIDTRKTRVILVEAGPRVLAELCRGTLGLCAEGARKARCRGSHRRAGDGMHSTRRDDRRALHR
jgi:CDGSH-type Zn-finger protein